MKINGREELCRWHLLDQIVKEAYGKGLEDLPDRHLLMQHLLPTVNRVSRYPPESVHLTDKNALVLEDHRTSYYMRFIEAHTVRLILETLTKGKFIEGARSIHYQLSQSMSVSIL